MGEGTSQNFQDPWSEYYGDHMTNKDQRVLTKEDLDNSVSSSTNSSIEDSTISNGSASSSLDTGDDASSSVTCSSSANSCEVLYDFSELMAELPIKRGLSKFYSGKSQSFSCLSRVTSIYDLAKKETPYRRKTKSSKSYQAGLDSYKLFTLPKPSISKKTPRASYSSSFTIRRVSVGGSSRPPQSPLKNLGC